MASDEEAQENEAAAAAAAEASMHDNNNNNDVDDRDRITFPPTQGHRHLDADHELFPRPVFARHRTNETAAGETTGGNNEELMGPLLRRKRVVSMPLGYGGDFFATTEDQAHDYERQQQQQQLLSDYSDLGGGGSGRGPASSRLRIKQKSYDPTRLRTTQSQPPLIITHLERQKTPPTPKTLRQRVKQDSKDLLRGVLRRKQVSLDLLGPNDFFALPEDEEAVEPPQEEQEEEGEEQEEGEEAKPEDLKLFRPLRFAPRVTAGKKKGRGGGGHGGEGHGAVADAGNEQTGKSFQAQLVTGGLTTIDEDTSDAFLRYSKTNQEVKLQIMSLRKKVEQEEDEDKKMELLEACDSLIDTQKAMKVDEAVLKEKLLQKEPVAEDNLLGVPPKQSLLGVVDEEEVPETDKEEDGEKPIEEYEEDDGIVRVTKSDKIKTCVCFLIMLGLTILVSIWDTHHDPESYIFLPIGLACVTPCEGNETTKDFFIGGHNQFETGDVISLVMHIDSNEAANETHAIVDIVGVESGMIKATTEFGPHDEEERISDVQKITVDFPYPEEHHVINVNSTDPEVQLSFTLAAHVQTPLSQYSVLVAALIMIFVYFFILIEVIHRTLVAIFGSMIALMFYFIMTDGETESIQQIMLNMEWSTLGLLFGMMLLVGELSCTGVFEWCAVRLLIASKGSFRRLVVLLCSLTAIASAFLDNVTTMLLVAPVTIDMCNILEVDPRPYLIGEILLSNIGGTATLIGDPPNIIIGSAYDEIIGFVDFITNVLPCIFLFCIPAALLLVLWIYRYYFTSKEMRVLDTRQLKKTYPIYDQPRLMIAGTVTFFVILMFFLHPVHHKDTAWIALVGAFVTIAFTNPHDVQDALRNHVEWDTLLFFAGLFVLVEVCAAMGLLSAIGDALAGYIARQPEESQLSIGITLIMWVSAFTSAFLDNIPYTATMIPIIEILSKEVETLPLSTLAWALSFGACLGGNGTLLGASANIVTAGVATNKGFEISFLNFLYPGMCCMIVTVAISNLYMLVRYSWIPN